MHYNLKIVIIYIVLFIKKQLILRRFMFSGVSSRLGVEPALEGSQQARISSDHYLKRACELISGEGCKRDEVLAYEHIYKAAQEALGLSKTCAEENTKRIVEWLEKQAIEEDSSTAKQIIENKSFKKEGANSLPSYFTLAQLIVGDKELTQALGKVKKGHDLASCLESESVYYGRSYHAKSGSFCDVDEWTLKRCYNSASDALGLRSSSAKDNMKKIVMWLQDKEKQGDKTAKIILGDKSFKEREDCGTSPYYYFKLVQLQGIEKTKLSCRAILFAYEEDSLENHFQYSQLLLQNLDNKEKENEEKAFKALYLAASANEGRVKTGKHEEAFRYLEEHAGRNSFASYGLAEIYQHGYGGVDKDEVRAAEYYKAAAEKNHIWGAYKYAQFIKKTNLQEAKTYFEQVLKLGEDKSYSSLVKIVNYELACIKHAEDPHDKTNLYFLVTYIIEQEKETSRDLMIMRSRMTQDQYAQGQQECQKKIAKAHQYLFEAAQNPEINDKAQKLFARDTSILNKLQLIRAESNLDSR